MKVQIVKLRALLTGWGRSYTAACIWATWRPWGGQWSRSPRRPQRSRSRRSSSPSRLLRGWSLQQRGEAAQRFIYWVSSLRGPPNQNVVRRISWKPWITTMTSSTPPQLSCIHTDKQKLRDENISRVTAEHKTQAFKTKWKRGEPIQTTWRHYSNLSPWHCAINIHR